MKMERIAAIVVTYNRKELLKECVSRLLTQQPVCDVLVVDNASTDGTSQMIRGMSGDPRLLYRNTHQNLGGAGGFNFGMRWAVEMGYDYLWIMDDDTLPQPDALARLWDAHERLNGRYGWLSSRCLWTDGGLCPMNLQRATPYSDVSAADSGTAPAQMASFVSLFLCAATVEQLGLPIKDFFIWTDDWEYTRRISRKFPCYVVWDSRVVHAMRNKAVVNIARDMPQRLFRYRYFYRNDVYLYRREGLKGWLWLLAKNCWHSIQTLTNGSSRFIKLQIIWKGFWQGLSFFPDIEYCGARQKDSKGLCQDEE